MKARAAHVSQPLDQMILSCLTGLLGKKMQLTPHVLLNKRPQNQMSPGSGRVCK